MTCELYINDVLCDLLYDEEVALLYQSPIFSGLDSIQSNRSYNIALPPTPTNIGAVRFAERPDIDSDVPYIRNAAALYLDGIPLFTQGFAVVTDITDTINVTLTWGNVDNFQPLFDANLRELGPQLEAAGCGHIAWNADSSLLPTNNANKYPGVAFWGINFGMGINDPKYLHPSVQVETILSAIEQYNGITIEGKERLAYSKNLGPIVPLVSINGDDVSGKPDYFEASRIVSNGTGGTSFKSGLSNYIVRDPKGIYTNSTATLQTIGANHMFLSITPNVAGNSFQIGCRASGAVFLKEQIHIVVQGNDKKEIVRISSDKVAVTPSTTYALYTFYKKDFPTELEVDTTNLSRISISLENFINVQSDGAHDIIVNCSVKLWGDIEITYPSIFPVAANLPDMSQGEFVLTLMTMNGLFAYADKDSPNTIRLISIDDIFARVDKGDILDWSDRVLLNDIYRVDMPDASVFSIDGLAQRNILDYDNDDDVRMDTYGMIKVHNENIEMETELAELPFSASESVTTSGVDCALVPIYESDGQGGAKYSEVTPRILSGQERVISDKSYCMGRFESWMKFGGAEGLVKSKYASYQKVVSRLRIITVRAQLSPLDLYNLDYTRPVYIAQFGQLFAIYSVETGGGGICECQLLKLDPSYYITLNGQIGDYSVQIGTAAQTITVPYRTNGTLLIEDRIGWFDSVDVGESSITVAVQGNTTTTGRVSELILSVREDRSIKRRILITQAVADPDEEQITAVSLLCKDFANLAKTIDLSLSTAGLTGRVIANFNPSGVAMLPPKTIMNAFGENVPLSKYAGRILTAVSGSHGGHRELPDSGGVIINLVKQ